MRSKLAFLTFMIAALSSARVFACASCGCTLVSNWENNTVTGLRFDLRYDYLDQNELRSETSPISAGSASQIVNSTSPQEVEQYTISNFITAGLDYTFNANWRVDVQIPYLIRGHSTLGTASNGITGGPGGGQYMSSTSSLSDVKVIGTYQGFDPRHTWGAMLGVKLPTGSDTLVGQSTDPTAPGPVPIDRGLQPGTGTTDLIAGVYHTDALAADWDYYTLNYYQYALYAANNYRPGNGLNVNLGVHYTGFSGLTPQVQINARYVLTDTGAQADTISTGGTLVYLSPGVNIPVGNMSFYVFYQLPLYEYLDGVQVVPDYTISTGARYIF